MATSLRSQRVLQRLSASTRSPPRSLFTPTRNSPTGSCILCQNHLSNPASRPHPRPQHHRTFTTTPRILASNISPETASPAAETEAEAGIPNAPNTTTYYTIFPQTLPSGPPPSSPFSIDVPHLRREFLQLQNTIHPDKYPSGPGKQQAESLSATINEAYRTLADPLLRAQYLLREFHGIDVTAEDGAGSHPLDPELLMEVMDVQEAIEEVGGGPEGEARIAEMKRENDERLRGCVEALARAFDEGDVQGATGECVRLKFWVSVAEGLKEWEPGMGGIRLIH
ncbi:HSCB C-terminal oligomerization domain-containing protein [Aspergillus aurantiobrunneus]